jgi:hypothetical protein
MTANLLVDDEHPTGATAFASRTVVARSTLRPWWKSVELWLLGVVLVAGVLFDSPDRSTVRLRFWPNAALPEICAARRCFGWQCPLCGATRSTLSLLQGRWRESLKLHRLGWWCLGIIASTAAVALACRNIRSGSAAFSERFTYWSWAVTGALLIANRAAELCGW